jgi:hypothetical protein
MTTTGMPQEASRWVKNQMASTGMRVCQKIIERMLCAPVVKGHSLEDAEPPLQDSVRLFAIVMFVALNLEQLRWKRVKVKVTQESILRPLRVDRHVAHARYRVGSE